MFRSTDEKERAVLDAVRQLGGSASSYDVWTHIQASTNRRWFIVTIHALAEHLVDRGDLTESRAPGGPERGHRDRAIWTLTDTGRARLG